MNKVNKSGTCGIVRPLDFEDRHPVVAAVIIGLFIVVMFAVAMVIATIW